jgi:hypothetical protein
LRCEWSFDLPVRRFTHNSLIRHVTKDIKNDTTEIRNDTTAIKDDTAQILAEIARLQDRLPRQVENDYILQHFLEEMTTYTEQTLDRPYSDERSPTPTVLQPDFDPPNDVYLQDLGPTAVVSTENLWNQGNVSCKDESQQLNLPATESTVPASKSSLQGIRGHNNSSDSEPGLQDIRPVNHGGSAPANIHTAKPMEEEFYYESKNCGETLGIDHPVAGSIRPNIRDQDCYESTHNRFTAVVCDPKEFYQLRHTFRPKLFANPRHIAMVFVLKVTGWTTYETFVHKWNFVTTAMSQATQKVDALRESLPQDYSLPWQHTVVLVYSPSRYLCDNRIWVTLTGLGVQHGRDDLMSLIGRTSSSPPLLRHAIKDFDNGISATIHEVGYYS